MWRGRQRAVVFATTIAGLAGGAVAVLPNIASASGGRATTAGGRKLAGEAALAILNEQRAANQIPPMTLHQGFATAWCPNEGSRVNDGDDGRNTSYITTWSRTSSPWDDAPIHQQDLYDPLFTEAGLVNRDRQACMGAGAPAAEPSSPTFYSFITEAGNAAVPISEKADELPISPQQVVGIPKGATTGPNLILYATGLPGEQLFGQGTPTVSSWSLTTAAGQAVNGVRVADAAKAAAAGYAGYIDGDTAMMIPPRLTPRTQYVAHATWQASDGTTATQTVTFTTV